MKKKVCILYSFTHYIILKKTKKSWITAKMNARTLYSSDRSDTRHSCEYQLKVEDNSSSPEIINY